MTRVVIGIVSGEYTLYCLSCMRKHGHKGEPITQEAYPDGFTCDECWESIADQNYKGEE